MDSTDPHPYAPDINSEDEYQKWLESVFESAGWTAIREVRPANSEYSADLIVHHEDYDWIGIETKYLDTKNFGPEIGRGFEQITQQYRGRRYVGNRIDLWAISPYYDPPEDVCPPSSFIREFFCYFGIGYISPHREIKIDFAYSDSESKIWVADISEYESDRERNESRYGSINKIQQKVEDKMDRTGGRAFKT